MPQRYITLGATEQMPTARYSRLAPLALEQRVQITLAALNFFSPMSYEKVSAAIDRPPTPGRTEPLDGGDFLKYLELSIFRARGFTDIAAMLHSVSQYSSSI